MKDLSIKFKHIIHNRDIGMYNLTETSERVLKKITETRTYYKIYNVDSVAGVTRRDGDGHLMVHNTHQGNIPWEEVPLDVRLEILFSIKPKLRATLDNIVNAYNKGMGNLVKSALKEFPRYVEVGKPININGRDFNLFWRNEDDHYFLRMNNGNILAWNGENSIFSDYQRMEIYNQLEDIIY